MNAMSNEQLAARAKLLLRELGFRKPSILQSWMVQYIAECLEAAEGGTATDAVRDGCASAIAQLWKLYIEDQRYRTARSVENYRFRSALDDAALEALRAELSDGTDAMRLTAESALGLRHLTLLEEHVLEVLWASTAVSDDDACDTSGAVVDLVGDSKVADLLAEFREETKTNSQRIVSAVFPEFGTLLLKDETSVTNAVTTALRKIDKARRRRIWAKKAQSVVSAKDKGNAASSAPHQSPQ